MSDFSELILREQRAAREAARRAKAEADASGPVDPWDVLALDKAIAADAWRRWQAGAPLRPPVLTDR